jgi:hypothetical protein
MKYGHLGALLLAAGCNNAGYDANAIRPTYGWDAGCTAVKVSGHGFGDNVTATIGGIEVLNLVRPTDLEDLNFFFFADTPVATEAGAQDLKVTSDDEEATVVDAFYYLTCPSPGYLEVVDPDAGLAAGATVSLGGCSLDAATMQVVLADVAGVVADATADLTQDCGVAYASFDVPAVAAGTYYLLIVDSTSGDVLNPASGDPRTCVPDTGAPCDPPFVVTIGGAR